MSSHPGVDDYDAASWLEGSLAEHDVIQFTTPSAGRPQYTLDPAPCFKTEGLGFMSVPSFFELPEDEVFATYCRDHAFARAMKLGGYGGPEHIEVDYHYSGRARRFLPETALILRDDDGLPLRVAVFGYGREYFEPGEPRTDPCFVCGEETLRCGVRGCDEHGHG